MTTADQAILRDLARQVAELAARPEQEEKRRLAEAHHRRKPIRPLVFCVPESNGAWVELIPDHTLACEGPEAREIELDLRKRIYTAEHFDDDQVCTNTLYIGRALELSDWDDWGVRPTYIHSDFARGAYTWDPPIKTHADIDRIKAPTVVQDREETKKRLEFYQDLLGDLMDIRLQCLWVSAGLIDAWTMLRGINQTYIDLVEDPGMVHAGMQRMMECTREYMETLEAQDLLSDTLDGHVKLSDMGGFADAQSMAPVSPAMHEEFVLRYQVPLLEIFQANSYGCCEPLHHKLAMLKRRVPRLSSVSISPFADRRISAEELGGTDIIYSWKPSPFYIAAVSFDGEGVRWYIRETIELCREHDCVLEMTLKDTHTCNNQPWRFEEWMRIAREEVERASN